MAEKREFEFSLKESIGVHKDGEKQFCNKILLKAPSVKNHKERCLIKQTFLSAIKTSTENQSTASSAENTEDQEISIQEQFVAVLYTTLSAEDILKTIDAFKGLLTSGCARVLDIPVTEYHLDQLASEDLDDMLGAYIENFIIPSWMKRAMKT